MAQQLGTQGAIVSWHVVVAEELHGELRSRQQLSDIQAHEVACQGEEIQEWKRRAAVAETRLGAKCGGSQNPAGGVGPGDGCDLVLRLGSSYQVGGTETSLQLPVYVGEPHSSPARSRARDNERRFILVDDDVADVNSNDEDREVDDSCREEVYVITDKGKGLLAEDGGSGTNILDTLKDAESDYMSCDRNDDSWWASRVVPPRLVSSHNQEADYDEFEVTDMIGNLKDANHNDDDVFVNVPDLNVLPSCPTQEVFEHSPHNGDALEARVEHGEGSKNPKDVDMTMRTGEEYESGEGRKADDGPEETRSKKPWVIRGTGIIYRMVFRELKKKEMERASMEPPTQDYMCWLHAPEPEPSHSVSSEDLDPEAEPDN